MVPTPVPRNRSDGDDVCGNRKKDVLTTNTTTSSSKPHVSTGRSKQQQQQQQQKAKREKKWSRDLRRGVPPPKATFSDMIDAALAKQGESKPSVVASGSSKGAIATTRESGDKVKTAGKNKNNSKPSAASKPSENFKKSAARKTAVNKADNAKQSKISHQKTSAAFGAASRTVAKKSFAFVSSKQSASKKDAAATKPKSFTSMEQTKGNKTPKTRATDMTRPSTKRSYIAALKPPPPPSSVDHGCTITVSRWPTQDRNLDKRQHDIPSSAYVSGDTICVKGMADSLSRRDFLGSKHQDMKRLGVLVDLVSGLDASEWKSARSTILLALLAFKDLAQKGQLRTGRARLSFMESLVSKLKAVHDWKRLKRMCVYSPGFVERPARFPFLGNKHWEHQETGYKIPFEWSPPAIGTTIHMRCHYQRTDFALHWGDDGYLPHEYLPLVRIQDPEYVPLVRTQDPELGWTMEYDINEKVYLYSNQETGIVSRDPELVRAAIRNVETRAGHTLTEEELRRASLDRYRYFDMQVRAMMAYMGDNPEIAAAWSQQKREEEFNDVSHYLPLFALFTTFALDDAKELLTIVYNVTQEVDRSIQCQTAYPVLLEILDNAGEDQATEIVRRWLDNIGYNPYHLQTMEILDNAGEEQAAEIVWRWLYVIGYNPYHLQTNEG